LPGAILLFVAIVSQAYGNNKKRVKMQGCKDTLPFQKRCNMVKYAKKRMIIFFKGILIAD